MSSSLFTTSILVIALAITLANARSSHSSGFGPPLRHNYTFEVYLTDTNSFLQWADIFSTDRNWLLLAGSQYY
ncbi:hypothetical protein PHLCEN_2v10054 [Hermanssonia centrifuga]|uniref:Uncharacterized protein n=1 Tax=Hermanssonia centrifuga TaxID=98765 RepID=A0A2R6NNT2_9APHY|nr:hypothetical protein PHLCEN_2v10054 [Hermanssonia centrifuga]